MRFVAPLRYLSFTVAIGLATALGVACSDVATAPQKFQPQSAALDRAVQDNAAFQSTVCTGFNYNLTSVNNGTADADVNQDGFVCVRQGPAKKK